MFRRLNMLTIEMSQILRYAMLHTSVIDRFALFKWKRTSCMTEYTRKNTAGRVTNILSLAKIM